MGDLPEPVPGCRRGFEDAVHSVAQVSPLYLLPDFLKDLDGVQEVISGLCFRLCQPMCRHFKRPALQKRFTGLLGE